MASESKGNKQPLLKYCVNVPDNAWTNPKDGKHGEYRGSSWLPHRVPSGPHLPWGSRLGVSVDARSKGVFFGTPGLPRCTYATPKVSPSLGPAQGLPKSVPVTVSKPSPPEYGTHLENSPASFVLEGVVGFNPNRAREIRKLRAQLASVEEGYKEEDRKLRRELHSSATFLGKNQKEIYQEDISRRDLEEKKEQMQKDLSAIRKMIDEQAGELKQRKKERMREEMRLGRTSSEAVVSSPDSPPQ